MSRRLTSLLARRPGGHGLGQVPADRVPTATTRMICGFCSTGCGLDVHLRDGVAIGLTPSPDHPVNLGMACPKGWEALTPLAAHDRATAPLLRDGHGHLREVGWDLALREMCERIRAVQAAHGPESVAFLSTGQIPTEEMALLGSLAKFGMGMRHGDGNTRQCMATSVVAYKQAFGFDAPPYTYADFEQSDVIVLVGSNLCIAHPIMWERVMRNPNHPEIVVIDPRVTETAMAATQHLAPRPKTDLTLLYGLAQRLLEAGAIDRRFVEAHTEGFEEFAAHVAAFTPERVEADTGVPAGQLQHLADTIARGRAVSFWWTMGVNQSHQGVRTAQAIIDLALMTGNIGRPGTGANSITGQCNAMGSRLFSNTTSLLGGHDFAEPAHRERVAEVLGIDEGLIPTEASWSYDRIIEGISRDEIKALWVIATNGAHSWINSSEVRDLLGRLDVLVVQDMYSTTETAQLADIVLPAAGWGEKEGSFINSERRLGLVKRVAHAPGQALADFFVFKAVADAWGCGDLFARWTDPEATFEILQELSRGRPCDLTGVRGYEHLDTGAVQWPYPQGLATPDLGVDTWDTADGVDTERAEDPDAGAPVAAGRPATPGPHGEVGGPEVERRLFADGRFFTPSGRARFVVDDPAPLPESTSARYPLVLLTGRGSSSQWHTGTRTSKSPTLQALAPSVLVAEVHPDDASSRGISSGDTVAVRSARGAVLAQAHVVASVGRGQVFLPMHDGRTNVLTFPAFDPHSRQPAYKHAAVEVGHPEPWEQTLPRP
jgi:anaerobic selenocysteine-containing dehydrogenase